MVNYLGHTVFRFCLEQLRKKATSKSRNCLVVGFCGWLEYMVLSILVQKVNFMYYTEFAKYGRMLWDSGLIHITSGNLSIRKGTTIYVTRTGSRLGDLSSSDIIAVNLNNTLRDKIASSETPVHREIYLAHPDVASVVHAHPPHATALSWDYTTIQPIDSDSLYIPEIPVLTDCPYGEGSACVAKHFPELLGKHTVALIRGHGAFSVGTTLEQATARLSMMENQCRLIYMRKLLEHK